MEVPEGSLVTLVGANGAGKSTTLRTICGLKEASRGQVFFGGQDLIRRRTTEIVKMGICMIPEGRQIFPYLTVYENLQLGAYIRSDRERIRRDLEWVFDIFPRLKERRSQKGGTLSGGEQQMLAFGRALMSRPTLLLMDEPSLGLAPILVEEVFSVIERIHQEGVTILLIEQNAHGALKVADYAYVMESGSIVLEGEAWKLADDEAVKKAYLGERVEEKPVGSHCHQSSQ
jgi:branched-chain amino acid transport system ATP-binding protein